MEQTTIMSLSETYRLMIYFAHSTMTIYSKTIKCNESMSVNDFRNANEKVVKRVFDEYKSIFNYELSYEQMSRAIAVYFQCKFRPVSVDDTEVYKIDKI